MLHGRNNNKVVCNLYIYPILQFIFNWIHPINQIIIPEGYTFKLYKIKNILLYQPMLQQAIIRLKAVVKVRKPIWSLNNVIVNQQQKPTYAHYIVKAGSGFDYGRQWLPASKHSKVNDTSPSSFHKTSKA